MDTLALSIRTRVTLELNTPTATNIANAETTSPPATTRVRMLVRWPSAKGANSRGSGRPWRSGRNDGMESSSEEKSVDGPDVWGACCGSLRGSSDAQVFEPSDRR